MQNTISKYIPVCNYSIQRNIRCIMMKAVAQFKASTEKVISYLVPWWGEINLFAESSMVLKRNIPNYSIWHDFNWLLNLNVVASSLPSSFKCFLQSILDQEIQNPFYW